MALIRQHNVTSLTIPSGSSLSSSAVAFGAYTMGTIHISASYDVADLGFKVASAVDGTYQPLRDKDGTLVAITTASQGVSYSLPPELATVRFWKAWSQTSGTSVDQGGARVLPVDLKG